MYNDVSKLDRFTINAFLTVSEWPYPCFTVWDYNCVQYLELDKSLPQHLSNLSG